MSILINLLADSGYIVVNKEIIKRLGLHESILLGELCSEYTYWENNDKLENGYFYSTRKNIFENTTLTPYQQRQILEKFEKNGIISVISKGMPLQNWYSINQSKLAEFLRNSNYLVTANEETLQQDKKKLNNKSSNSLTTRNENISQHDVKPFYINNKKNNNKKNNNNDDREKVHSKKNVLITRKQYNILIAQYGKERIDRLINRLDLYKKSTGKRYKDDYATLLLWVETDLEKEKKNTNDNSKLDSKEMRLKNLQEKFGENLEKLYANYTAFKE